MAEAFLEEIYQYANVTAVFHQMTEYLRVEDSHHTDLLWEKYKQTIVDTCERCRQSGYPEAGSLWELICHVYRVEKDTIVKADIMENAIIPILEKWIQSLGSIVQQVDGEYQLESTASGFLTLKSLRTGRYLHSNNNPMVEAKRQIEYFYEPSVDSYAVLGCGLGYQVYQLYRLSNASIKIKLYEWDKRMVEYARQYGVLNWIPQDVLEVITEDSLFAFLQEADSHSGGAYMHLPSLRQIENRTERNAMLRAYEDQHTGYAHRRDFQINFWRNIHSGARHIEDLDSSAVGAEVVVVAAGPSLDDFIEILRKWQGEKTIIAVGTVLAKLLRRGIRPDFVVITDPQQRTVKQIEGLWEETIPMILDAVAYWEFARKYQGDKYLVLTLQTAEVNEYAKDKKIRPWPSGGTVTSLAIEMASKFHAKAVYLMGVDLSYPQGMSHASDTLDRKEEDIKGMIPVQGVMGQTVYTTSVFRTYHEWIEDHIAHHPETTWYNLSTVGARLEGTKEIGQSVLEGNFCPA